MSATLGACTPAAPSQVNGSYVEVDIHSDDAEFCGSTIDHLDRFVERVFAFLGEPTPHEFVVPINVFDAETPCSSLGCYDKGRIWLDVIDTSGAQQPAETLRHELVHAIHDRVWGMSVPFFNEGLAQSLSAQTNSRPATKPIRDMLDKLPREFDYDAAGRFVRFLIDTRGLPRFRELFQGAPGRDGAGLRAWIGEVYGEPFENIENEYLSGDPRCYYQLHLCNLVDGERIGDEWFMTTPASCHDLQFYGASTSHGELFAMHRPLELVQGGRYLASTHFAFEQSDPDLGTAHVALLSCGTCDQFIAHRLTPNGHEIQLAAGAYTLEIVMPFDTLVSVSLVRLGD
ncbi:hypothetical protein [Nannocystis pusilla]|uniref:hypothetical protein n=1 Tax=Nannocystis pusilla TaxID=889268 RepID=UPI003DA44A66